MRLARFEGDPQRLARAEQVLLAYDFISDRGRSLSARARGSTLPKVIPVQSPRTSTPVGRVTRKVAGSICGLRARFEKRSTVVWPK